MEEHRSSNVARGRGDPDHIGSLESTTPQDITNYHNAGSCRHYSLEAARWRLAKTGHEIDSKESSQVAMMVDSQYQEHSRTFSEPVDSVSLSIVLKCNVAESYIVKRLVLSFPVHEQN